jgi:hypothetical protein
MGPKKEGGRVGIIPQEDIPLFLEDSGKVRLPFGSEPFGHFPGGFDQLDGNLGKTLERVLRAGFSTPEGFFGDENVASDPRDQNQKNDPPKTHKNLKSKFEPQSYTE